MAFQDLIKYGVNTQGDRFGGLGEAAKKGFLEGEQRVKDMADRAFMENERKRVADEREQKELDAIYGELYVPPTGSQSYDAGVEAMGREWKSEFAALNAAKKAGQVDNETYVAQKHDILNRAKELKAGQNALNQSFQMYKKAAQEGQVSESTPARIKLLFQALEDGTAEISNIEGRPTLVGNTSDGEPIQIDMAAIASGNAPLRFNQKVDSTGLVDTIAKTLEGYKTTIATDNGLALGNVGWDMIQERAAQDIDQILNNASTVEALAADELGYNHEEIKALGQEETKNRVGDYLLDKVQREYFPVQKIDKFTGLTDAQAGSLDLQRQRLNQAQQGRGDNAALLKFYQQQGQIADTATAFNNAIQSGDLRGLIGLGQIQNVKAPGWVGNKYTIETKAGKIKVDPTNPADIQILRNLLGIGAAEQSAQGASADADPLGLGI